MSNLCHICKTTYTKTPQGRGGYWEDCLPCNMTREKIESMKDNNSFPSPIAEYRKTGAISKRRGYQAKFSDSGGQGMAIEEIKQMGLKREYLAQTPDPHEFKVRDIVHVKDTPGRWEITDVYPHLDMVSVEGIAFYQRVRDLILVSKGSV